MSIQLHRMVVTPRRLIVLGATLLIAVVLALTLIRWQAGVTVRMAIPARTGSAPFYVAMDKGFFRSEGVRVELTVPTTGKAGIQMLAAGSMDLWVSLQPAEMPHALASGQVDGASNIEPFLLPDFQRYCYDQGLQSVLQSGILPTPQEGVE